MINLAIRLKYCLFIVLSLYLPGHAATEGAKVLQNKPTTIYALQIAAKHNVFEGAVLMQRIYSPTMVESIVLTPLVVGELHKSVWKLEVVFQNVRNGHPSTKMTNRMQSGHHSGNLNAAVFVAGKYLNELGRLSLPVLIETKQIDGEYAVTFTRLPQVVGGVAAVIVSNDLKHCRLLLGH